MNPPTCCTDKSPSWGRHQYKWIHDIKYRVTQGNLISFEWVVLRTAPKKNKLCQCVVSTRWCHSAHRKRVTIFRNMLPGHLISRFGDVPWPPRSPDLSTCDLFFFGGIWNRVFTLTSPVRWMIWRKLSVRKFVRSIVSCWPVSWTI